MAKFQNYLPAFLYRYRRIAEDAHVERELAAIKDQYLWFDDLGNMNDPMEGEFVGSKRFQKSADYARLKDQIRDMQSSVGFCCFCESYNIEPMWTHYATNYKGICIAYDTQKLLAGLRDDVQLVRMSYDVEPPVLSEDDVKDLNYAARKVLAFKKSSWASEREWRLLGPKKGKVPLTSKGCARRVFLGPKMLPEHYATIKNQIQAMRVSVFEMTVLGYEHKWEKTKSIK